MAADTIELKTKRLILKPVTEAELDALIDGASDEETKREYTEMKEEAAANPEAWIWYAPWKICLRNTDICVGNLGFKGPEKDNAVEIGYGLNKEYEGNGYMTEAVGAVSEWLFMNKKIVFIEAETATENEASKKVLERLNFKPDGEGEEGPRYVLEAPKSAYLSIFMCLGMSFGIAIGMLFDSFAIGMCLGLCAGMCLGAALDAKTHKERDEIKENRKNRKEQK